MKKLTKNPLFILAVLAVAVGAFALFRPDTAFRNTSVNESLPASATEAAMPETVLTGSFESQAHHTEGQVRVVQLEDGSVVARIEGLSTSNGPDLRVTVRNSQGERVDLGALKANQGNQNYVLPQDLSVEEIGSLSIWCRRFNVDFGTAELM